MYARSKLGDQSTISLLLNEKIKDVGTLIGDWNDDCVKQVFRVLCYFYLPPCGNSTHPVPPSSICLEECQMVQNKCQKAWHTLLLVFKGIDPIIQCNDTSRLLFPLPHCCIDAELGLSLHLFPSITSSSPEASSLLKDKQRTGTEVEISVVISIILVALMMVIFVVLIFIVSFKLYRRKKMQLETMNMLVS